jgi:AcrR family transcriptional regulator
MGSSLGDVRERIADAALVLVAERGFGRTTLADVAREANCGRATVYRAIPGGKTELLRMVALRELHRFFEALVTRVDAAPDLEEALVVGLTTSAVAVRDHAALQRVLLHEPEVVLPYLGFRESNRLYAAAASHCGPHIARFVDPEVAGWAAEWVARIVISYAFNPHESIDLTNEADARQLTLTLLLPALQPETSPDPSGGQLIAPPL